MRQKKGVDRITSIDGRQYKLTLLKDRTAKNLHHVLGRCNNLEYNTDNKDNKIMVNEIGHDNLNRFFGNRQAPHLQLKYMLEERGRKQVLSPAVVQELYTLLSLPREEFYKEHLVKDKHKGKALDSNEKIFKDTVG